MADLAGATTALDADRRHFLADLVASGRFCRDTRLGGILHPGAVSLREVTDGDSLHVVIGDEDRISVHVDRFSPVAGSGPEGCCTYSVRAVFAHMAAHIASQVRRVAQGVPGRHRCRLHCELVEDEDDLAKVLGCDDDPGSAPRAAGVATGA